MPPTALPPAPLYSRRADKSNPAARSEQAKDWAAKRAEAIAKAAKIRCAISPSGAVGYVSSNKLTLTSTLIVDAALRALAGRSARMPPSA